MGSVMPPLTEEGRARVADIAARHGVAPATAEALLAALERGGGAQAQFNAPELGGMGQWSRGGMVMIGDMFNNALKARVDTLCSDLAGLVGAAGIFEAARIDASGFGSGRWPAELGQATSSGAQNDMRYAVFPASRRLAVERGGTVTIYDTGPHVIGGVSQAQSSDQTLTFSSQLGRVSLLDLDVVGAPATEAVPTVSNDPAPPTTPVPREARVDGADPVELIERLAGLRDRGILTDEEFAQKKVELLARL